jgi:hypothetical protein
MLGGAAIALCGGYPSFYPYNLAAGAPLFQVHCTPAANRLQSKTLGVLHSFTLLEHCVSETSAAGTGAGVKPTVCYDYLDYDGPPPIIKTNSLSRATNFDGRFPLDSYQVFSRYYSNTCNTVLRSKYPHRKRKLEPALKFLLL